ncbi:MAG: radical SAM protein [Armatimonadota bacterium]
MSGEIVLSRNRSLTPIIKVTGDSCNLRCSYCFYSKQDQNRQQRMGFEILESFLKQHIEFFEQTCCFVWHGGEPLLAGIDFFEEVVALQKKYARPEQRMINSIQTNASLVTNSWGKFFKEHDFHVGVSLDGESDVHDRFRRSKGGRGSYERVIRGIEVLRRHGLSFGIVQVLTASTASRARETFRYFADDVGAKHWSMNAFVDLDGYSCVSDESLSCDQWRDALMVCIDEWMSRGNKDLVIREIESLVTGVMGRRTRACSYNGGCARYYCVNWDGGVYPCDNFTNDPGMRLGALEAENLIDVLGGARRREILNRMTSTPSNCRSCEWLQACHNGCPSHRKNGIGGCLVFCSARKELFGHMKSLIQQSGLVMSASLKGSKQ